MTTATAESTPARSDVPSPYPDLLINRDMADLFRVSPQTIGLWVRQGLLPSPLRIGTKSYWRRDVIERLVARAGIEAMTSNPEMIGGGTGRV